MWRTVIAIVLLAHGIGHSLGMFPALGLAKTERWSDHSWLMTNFIGESAARWLGVLLWLAVMLGFIGAGLGFYGILVPQDWWRSLAAASAVVSLVGLALYWNAFPSLINKIGAIAVDVAVLVALLWAHWQTADIAS